MAVFFKNKKGKEVILLNPSEKARKFADELGNGVKQTNKGSLKYDKNGNYARLSDTEKAYRSGYLDARKDSAKAYKATKKKGY